MTNYLKEFIAILQHLDYSRKIFEVFRDFLTLSTCAIAQPFYRSDEIEQQYLETVKRYNKEQAEQFSKLLALLVSALSEQYQDFLGKVYMQLNLGNARTGQFFTPYHISQMMAEITFIDSKDDVKSKEIITLSEPYCGSGGMVIAYAETMKKYDINFQERLFVEAIDIDEMCFQMAYLQLSLYGIPARVLLGDTIAYKFSKLLYTPMYFINGFSWKLKEKEQAEIKSEQEVIKEVVEMKQLSLFWYDTNWHR